MNFEEMINTIQLGDCYELIKQIPDKSVDCIYVDIPYLYQEGGSGSSRIAQQVKKMKKNFKMQTYIMELIIIFLMSLLEY